LGKLNPIVSHSLDYYSIVKSPSGENTGGEWGFSRCEGVKKTLDFEKAKKIDEAKINIRAKNNEKNRSSYTYNFNNKRLLF
jgi:hypothetical protein